MPYKLDDHQVQRCLQDIEDSSLCYKDVDFLTICNDDIRHYGEPGGEKRRAFQMKVGYYKKWPVQKYVAFLDENGVTPSATTLRFLREAPPQEQMRGEDEDEAEEQRDDGDGDDDDGMDGLASDLDRMAMEDDAADANPPAPPPAPASTPNRSPPSHAAARSPMVSPPPFKSPARATARMSPARYGSPPRARRTLARFGSPVRAPAPTLDFQTVYGGGDTEPNGSAANPFCILVDSTRPERHREFDIERVVKIKHNGFEYNRYHVHTPIAVPDYDHWEAFIPQELPKHLRKYKNRAILVRGPAQSFWLRNNTRYHRKQECEQTLNSHKGTHLEIEQDPDRFFKWILLVWRSAVVLDNSTFSGHPTKIDKTLVSMEAEAEDYDNETGKKLYGMNVFWRIAEKYGSRQLEDI
jgi:hypothetical protein